MDEAKRKELLELAVWVPMFSLGAFTAVVVSLAWIWGFDDAGGLAGQFAVTVVSAAGFAAPLLAAVGLCIVAAMMFLVDTRIPVERHLAGLLGSAAGMAVLVGAAREGAGPGDTRLSHSLTRLESTCVTVARR